MRLTKRQADGATVREHLQAAAAATGKADPSLSRSLPRALVWLWQAFCELSAARPVGMAAGAIPGTEIEAWQRLARVTLLPWEVDTLRAMDRAALAVMNEKAPSP
jgi:hypothetical protein